MRVGPMGPSTDMSASTRLPRPSAIPRRSAPAQKVPCVPVSTATESESSESKVRNVSANSPAVGPSTALRTSGRSMATTSTSPSRPTSRLPAAPEVEAISVVLHAA